MPSYDVLLYVDGNVLVTVDADDEAGAAVAALERVSAGDFAEAEVVHTHVDEIVEDAGA